MQRAAEFQAIARWTAEGRASTLEFRNGIGRTAADGPITRGSAAAKPRKTIRWQGLLARQTRQILLPGSNSFPKQGASENFGSRMTAS